MSIAIIITDFSYFNRREYHQIAHLKFEECLDPDEIVEEDLNEAESMIITDKAIAKGILMLSTFLILQEVLILIKIIQ